jgi:hypothetical protein
VKAQGIEFLLQALGAERVFHRGDKVRSSCPLGPWRHSSGRDSNPSFAVFVKEKDTSHCRCMAASCGFKGTLLDLVMAVQVRSGRDLSKLQLFVKDNDQQDNLSHLEKLKYGTHLYGVPRESSPASNSSVLWSNPNAPDYSDPLVMAAAAPGLPAEETERVEKMIELLDDEALYYLHLKRGLTDDAIAAWKLGWHPQARRISIPQYDVSGRLVNVGGRYVPSVFDDWHPPPWMHAAGFKKELYLFGEDKFLLHESGKGGTMFLVEGMFDAIYLWSRGLRNVGAMCGSYVSRIQGDKIVKWFDRLIIVPDGDKPGYEAADRIMQLMGKRMRHGVHIYPTPDGKDPDQLTDDEIRDLATHFAD